MSAIRPVIRSTVNRMNTARVPSRKSSYGHGPPADYKPPTMNELPVPQGSWQAKYDADQRKYNATLFAGVGIFAATIIGMKVTGFNFHYLPPDTYE